MKITDVTFIPLSFLPPRPPRDGLSGIAARDVFLVQIHTDVGITGTGECFALGTLRTLASIVDEILKPVLIGQDPTLIESLWEKMYRHSFRVGRRGIVLAAISGIDIALWDILGQAAKLPLYRLLGGAHERILAYASGGYYLEGKDLDELQQEMAGYAEQGFKAVKMKIGGSETLQNEVERVRYAREALGANIELAVDANNAWDFNTALRMARLLEPFNILWFEEPLSSDDIESSVALAAATDIPIAGYETEYTRFGLRDMITRRAVDIVQTDVIWSGGMTECRKIATLASTWGMPCIPHFSASAISLAANLHFGCSIPNATYFELTQDENPLRDELLNNPIVGKNGWLTPPEAPGLGIDINWSVIEKYRAF
jgi:L-alanine-DL-glutamate epimerase-like enolase superfamily enzyme